MPHERLTLPEHLCSPPGFSGVRVSQSLVFFVVFCRSLFVLLSLCFCFGRKDYFIVCPSSINYIYTNCIVCPSSINYIYTNCIVCPSSINYIYTIKKIILIKIKIVVYCYNTTQIMIQLLNFRIFQHIITVTTKIKYEILLSLSLNTIQNQSIMKSDISFNLNKCTSS